MMLTMAFHRNFRACMAGATHQPKGWRSEQSFCFEDIAESRWYAVTCDCTGILQLANLAVSVIRLKQVEHVRNERNVLAAVAGHPFITTMVASFQDADSLYMLVRC